MNKQRYLYMVQSYYGHPLLTYTSNKLSERPEKVIERLKRHGVDVKPFQQYNVYEWNCTTFNLADTMQFKLDDEGDVIELTLGGPLY